MPEDRPHRELRGDTLRIIARLTEGAPFDLRLLGKTLLHSAAVGALAGLLGAAFFASLELAQQLLLVNVAGLPLLRAVGETFGVHEAARSFRPVVAALLPAAGGLATGLLTWRFARETAGGGGDATIDAFHGGGVIRGRVIPVKALASILTLSSGGSGGREGPTMHIGAAIGAAVGRILPTSRAERRVLVVAGVAAGVSAVFRTPLGSALLATEMLYRDDFEAEALVPAVLSSVVSYSIVIALFGESTLFGRVPRFPFTPAHLPLYFLLALVIALAAVLFVKAIRAVRRACSHPALPPWLAPAVGGLAMGALASGVLWAVDSVYGESARGLGVYGGGYGLLQAVISGTDWLGHGWSVVALLLALAFAKLAASALTIGSGGSAGDFAPSLVVGGLVGAAFAHGARVALGDPSIDPAAFTLVGMGTFYGGIAHVPLSALVLVAELAGSYDLLVPMMLAIGVAYIALRNHTLYESQPASRSALLRAQDGSGALARVLTLTARDLLVPVELPAVDERATLEQLANLAAGAERQSVVAVTDGSTLKGLVEVGAVVAIPAKDRLWLRAHDAVARFASVEEDTPVLDAARVLERSGVSQVPVLRSGEIVGWIGDRELRRALLAP